MSKVVAGLMLVSAVSMFGVKSSAAADTAGKTIVEVAVAADNFKTLVTAVKAADLVETLSGKGPFTVFAPTDEAFKKVPKEALAELLKPEKDSSGEMIPVKPSATMTINATRSDRRRFVTKRKTAMMIITSVINWFVGIKNFPLEYIFY